ncbi:restriction endonuclease subunit S [Actinomyces oris]|uniref:Restriction endonuclease subunit S n=1 Tax=Actinomyces oris TaxID=544580 RepID=A0A508BQY1_9ACTO|nr:restriction endonuclease subunit S [Actinomyces oris]QQC39340.1 restriction endonuclease subunit S [Actinomyces oris]TQD63164.1 restriction endonuclease subunit S [Actinomyces oris]
MSHIDDLIRDLCPDGVEYKPLGEVGRLLGGLTGKTKADFIDGTARYVSYKNVYSNLEVDVTADDFVRISDSETQNTLQIGDILFTGSSENREEVGLTSVITSLPPEPLYLNSFCICFRPTENFTLLPEFAKHLFRSAAIRHQVIKTATGVTRINISRKNLAKIQVPLPPVEVQQEVARILDQFTQLEAELEAELEVRKQQYSHYLNHFFSPNADTRMRTLKDVGPIRMCKRILKRQTSQKGDVPFYKIKTFGGTADAYISRNLYEEYKERYSFPKPGSVLISAAGTIGRAVPYDGRDAYFQDSNIVWIENDETVALNRYLFYYYKIADWKTDGGTIKRLYNDRILNTAVPVPPLSEQHRIVDYLDKFDALINDLTLGLPAEIEARRKQYEYYRDRLLTFPEKN